MDLVQLDAVVSTFYGGSQEQIAKADAALAAVREHWWSAGPWRLLEALAGAQVATPTVLWSCALVEQWLRRRWRRLPESERAACRMSVVQLIIAAAQSRASGTSKRASASEDKLIASKLEHLLASLLRADWPAGWPSFLPDLLQAPQLDDSARLRISLLLAEEAVASRGGGREGEAADGGDGGLSCRWSSQHASIRALLEANGGQQAAQLLSLCHRAIAGGMPGGDAALAAESVQLGLAIVARFSPCIPLPVLLAPALLDPLPRLLERFRCSVLKLLAELSRVESAPPHSSSQPLALLHAAMRDVFGRVLVRLPPQFARACGQVGGGEAAWSWSEAQLDDLSLWLAALWSGQRHALAQTAGGCELLSAALGLLGALGDASARGSERERICMEHACSIAADLRRGGGGDAFGPTQHLLGTIGPALNGARASAIRLLCGRMARPASMLLWVEDDDDDEEDPEVQEELQPEASAASDEAHASASHALGLLLEDAAELAPHARGTTFARLAAAASRPVGALAECCQASWALAALLRAAPSAEAAAVCVHAVQGLTQGAAAQPARRRVLTACAALLIATFPPGLHGADAGAHQALRDVFGRLLEWLRDPSEAMSRMAAAALRALCGAPELAPAFWGGAEPLLPSLLNALPQALETTPLSETQLLAVHDALARALAASVACGALPAAALPSCVDRLLTHGHQRWAPLVELARAATPPGEEAVVDAAKEAATLLRIYARLVPPLGRGVVLHHLEALAPPLLALMQLWTAQLARRVQPGAPPDVLLNALGSLHVRRLRSARAVALEVLVHVCSAPAAGHTGRDDDERAAQLATPFVQLLLPHLAAEPPPLRPPQLAQLMRALVERAPAYREMTAENLRHGITLVLRPTLEAAAAVEASGCSAGRPAGTAAAGSAVAAAGGGNEADRERAAAHAGAAVGLVGVLATHRPDALERAPREVSELIASSIACALSQPKAPLSLLGDAIRTLHVLVQLQAISAEVRMALLPTLRSSLAAVQTTSELRSLCRTLQLTDGGSRAEIHAKLLGLSPAEFEALHAQESAESEAEHEGLWLDE